MATYQSEADAIAGIKAHPVCADFMATPTRYVVFYPDTYKIPGGTAVQIGLDALAALNLLYARLDDFWNAQRLQVAAE